MLACVNFVIMTDDLFFTIINDSSGVESLLYVDNIKAVEKEVGRVCLA